MVPAQNAPPPARTHPRRPRMLDLHAPLELPSGNYPRQPAAALPRPALILPPPRLLFCAPAVMLGWWGGRRGVRVMRLSGEACGTAQAGEKRWSRWAIVALLCLCLCSPVPHVSMILVSEGVSSRVIRVRMNRVCFWLVVLHLRWRLARDSRPAWL